MNALWELGVPRRDLHVLAARLGSDVPFALHGGTALGTGRGEELATVLTRKTFHWVLAFADGGLSTPAVFAELDRLREHRAHPPRVRTSPSRCWRRWPPVIRSSWRRCSATTCRRPRSASNPALRRTLRAGVEAGALAGVVSGLRADVRVSVRVGGVGGRCRGASWPAAGCAARCGWPAGRSTAPGWCPSLADHRGRCTVTPESRRQSLPGYLRGV